jgi:hypothetical protein
MSREVEDMRAEQDRHIIGNVSRVTNECAVEDCCCESITLIRIVERFSDRVASLEIRLGKIRVLLCVVQCFQKVIHVD